MHTDVNKALDKNSETIERLHLSHYQKATYFLQSCGIDIVIFLTRVSTHLSPHNFESIFVNIKKKPVAEIPVI